MWAQTGTKTTTTQKPAATKFRGRLPNGYGKLGLDSKQRTAIYAVQEKFHAEIDELEQRIEALKTKQNEEILAVLTAEQKAALQTSLDKTKTPGKTTKPSTEE
jgi:phage shock protein A